jgi:hypothetical protein
MFMKKLISLVLFLVVSLMFFGAEGYAAGQCSFGDNVWVEEGGPNGLVKWVRRADGLYDVKSWRNSLIAQGRVVQWGGDGDKVTLETIANHPKKMKSLYVGRLWDNCKRIEGNASESLGLGGRAWAISIRK